ncbi:UDP-glucose 4-epimerase GalE [Kitasatospora aureofaciens]|uniref:UDP-glucose 4-epimerase n=1 Tax=Kitasatospora aureofaciens TaxID=1894 RepID=A0A1E7N6D8_KITAU|nr:UDP-glucose 4-epimerase GalE [Kitasatospora aureofaciens]QEV01099.1 UDP-glucose 4-epimerase GalE [Streptomyces viridifaciens]ARF79850.1 UDP-glucose 4-epimerase GalE [Kitasatospora aureofaciens]OEV36238.1 UDP-glucose 4-epimerase GalE [Kitasatospora aureofaciens]UKZ07450.1 UDP-glucose 4-epimerase GalE [Streptomyces viridifaciens]GGU86441.1 UDP-glucose 4-epimerase GalE [Kitasatospora aureofaciens]
MTWLITGGAGYIGGHVVRQLLDAGERVAVLDDLSTGDASRVPDGVPLIEGSTLDRAVLDTAIREHGIEGVLHFAAKKQVGESVEQPFLYYRENMIGLQTVLEAAAGGGVKRFLFSSSAAVYGMPDVDLVTESTPCAPMSPYGETKLAGEWLVAAAGKAYGMSTVALRYFNVAGAASPELSDAGVFNLIPMVFERLTAGEAPRVFGDDYATPDGSCVRDFIHVSDIASAHVAAAKRLAADPAGETALVLNIGRGEGVSVKEMIEVIGKVTGYDVTAEVTPRRPGDPARVVAAADLIHRELGWSASHDVADMVSSAWEGWCSRHPEARKA